MTAAKRIARAMRTIRVLWISLLVSVCLLLVVSFVVPPLNAPGSFPMTNVYVLVAAAVGAFIASFVMPARMYARKTAEVVEPEPVSGGLRGPARFANPGLAATRALAIGQTAFILSMALSEVNALLGFVLNRFGLPQTWSLPFFAVALTLMAIRFPTPERIVGPFERRHGATFAASEPAAY